MVIQKHIIVRRILSTVAIVLWILPVYAQTIKRMDDQTWNAINTAVSNSYNNNNLKGISVAVVYGGNIAYANAFGDKNEAGDPFTIETKSLLASVSKLITGILAMRLAQNGDIDIDDPISDYVTGYNGSGITIRHLLAHQSGIAHYSDCPNGYNGAFNAFSSHLTVLGCTRCLTPPGSSTLYTTFGTTLLGVIIDNVGQDVYNTGFTGLYEAWIRNPGGLTTLTPESNNLDILLAEGEDGPGYWNDIGWKLPAGGFISDIVDLANFARGILNNTFINQSTYDTMKIDQDESGTPSFSCGGASGLDYGLAFVLSGGINDDDFFTWHNGENDDHGYSSYFAVYPNSNAAVVMMTNTEDATGALNTLRSTIQDLILCPSTRDFTNNISWTEPRIFEGGTITGRSEITSANTDAYIFDADFAVKLLPGFKAPAGKIFRAIVNDGCGGSVETD